jgi:hypothetical protein
MTKLGPNNPALEGPDHESAAKSIIKSAQSSFTPISERQAQLSKLGLMYPEYAAAEKRHVLEEMGVLSLLAMTPWDIFKLGFKLGLTQFEKVGLAKDGKTQTNLPPYNVPVVAVFEYAVLVCKLTPEGNWLRAFHDDYESDENQIPLIAPLYWKHILPPIQIKDFLKDV